MFLKIAWLKAFASSRVYTSDDSCTFTIFVHPAYSVGERYYTVNIFFLHYKWLYLVPEQTTHKHELHKNQASTIDSYSVNRSLTTSDFCLKTVINHNSSSPFISLLSVVVYCFIVFILT